MDDVASSVKDLVAVRRAAQQDRVATATKRRKELKELLDTGLVPPRGHNPRYEWLAAMSDLMLDTLSRTARDFNEANPDECILVQDVYDALLSAAKTLLTGPRKTEEPT
jgi:hypothetical protein